MVAVIREANLEDYKAVINLLGEYSKDQYAYLALDNDSFKRVLEEKFAYLLLAERDSEIIGFINASLRFVLKSAKPVMEIEDLFVLDQYRQKGIGRRLLEKVETIAKEQNCKFIYIPVAKERDEALHFLKAQNYHLYADHLRKIV